MKSVAKFLLMLVAFSMIGRRSVIVLAQCNVCSVLTNVACVSTTAFQICVDGTPTGDVFTCPTGYVCSSLETAFCQLEQNGGAVVSCSDCNVCDATGTFACTGTQTYALCLGGDTPSSLTGSCAPDYICNIESAQICTSLNMGVQPTCPTAGEEVTTTTTTTVSPITSPAVYCQSNQLVGRFPVGTDLNNTCRQYVYCFIQNGNWSGAVYNCPGQTYFNSTSQLCDTEIPTRCTVEGSTTNLGLIFN